MNKLLIKNFIEIIEQVKLKGFTCDVTTRRIVFSFSEGNQQVHLNDINKIIKQLNELIKLDSENIKFLKDDNFLELYIPFEKEIENPIKLPPNEYI